MTSREFNGGKKNLGGGGGCGGVGLKIGGKHSVFSPKNWGTKALGGGRNRAGRIAKSVQAFFEKTDKFQPKHPHRGGRGMGGATPRKYSLWGQLCFPVCQRPPRAGKARPLKKAPQCRAGDSWWDRRTEETGPKTVMYGGAVGRFGEETWGGGGSIKKKDQGSNGRENTSRRKTGGRWTCEKS